MSSALATCAPGLSERVERVRRELARENVDALIVYNNDPHLSEYLPDRWQARQWLSGFKGSAGIVAITAERAAIFVDSRYLILAEQAFAGTPVEVHLIGPANPAPHLDWLEQCVRGNGTVLADGHALEVREYRALSARLGVTGVQLRTDIDLFDTVWEDRPPEPAGPVWFHEAAEVIQPATEKLARLREEMHQHGATHHFISALDEIAWITNLRGSDIEHNPLFAAHLMVTVDDAILFTPEREFDAPALEALRAADIRAEPYAAATDVIRQLPANAAILLDPKRITWGFHAAIPDHCRIIEAINPAALLKRVKRPAEVASFRETMIEDGVALVRFQAEFEESMARGERWTEWTVHERLTHMRAQSPLFRGLSFPTCAGFNPNGAIPHYSVAPESALDITGDGLLLIDSGGQYLGGTTDVCRVWAIGKPTDAMRRDATVAMRGLIAISTAKFPAGIPGPMIDAIARAPLWAEGLDYFHGTGHGVGCFLGVHELPTLLSGRMVEPGMEYVPGVVSAIEPGVYRPGQYGVRHENIAVVVDAGETKFGRFAGFETLTLCPFDRRCLIPDRLDQREAAWLDAYHRMVRERLAPRLEGRALAWLLRHTGPLLGH
jgi:Xaa-Pro aminopeptidase